jgi:DivIVA domain-containing protein
VIAQAWASAGYGCHTPAHEGKRSRPVNGDEVRNVEFYGGPYSAAEVDDLLERVAAELDAGRPAGPLIARAMFRERLTGRSIARAMFQEGLKGPIIARAMFRERRKFRSGYDTDAVDWFLDQLQRREDPSEAAREDTDPWRDLAADRWCFRREPGDPAVLIDQASSDEYADDWRDFDRQPGTRLSWERTGRSRREVRTADQQAIASVRYDPVEVFRVSPLGSVIQTISVGGRTFTMRRLPEDTWERIAGTIGRDRPVPAHMLRPQTDEMLRRQTDDICYSLRQLLDETGEPVLYTEAGRHKNYFAGSYIKFPDQRWLRF